MEKNRKEIKEKVKNLKKSLWEVEGFLNNWQKILKGIKIYKMLK